MNKTDLIEAIAKDCDLSKVAAQAALDSILDAIVSTVKKDKAVQLVGFGSFSATKRAARIGRNPQTGEEMNIPASKTVKFAPSKILKKTVNKK